MPPHDHAIDELMQRTVRLWDAVPRPDTGPYDHPPRVGVPVDDASLAGLLRRGRTQALASLWPSLSIDQRAAALFAGSSDDGPGQSRTKSHTPADRRLEHSRSGISDWLLALLLAERHGGMLRSIELTTRQWWLVWHDPLELLPAPLRTGPASAWVHAGAHDRTQRDHLRRAAFASPSAVRLPISLLMAMGHPWTPTSARVLAAHPDTPTAVLLDVADLPSLSATARASLAVHRSFPIGRVASLFADASDPEIGAVAGVTADPARVLALLDQPVPSALASALVRAHDPAAALVTEPSASERALVMVLRELDVTQRPDLVEAALDAPRPAARRALARTVDDPQVLARLASDTDAAARALAAERVVHALHRASRAAA